MQQIRPRATMRDVAALAGVSLKTVSRVVNDEAGVGDAVRARVRAAVVQLDYRHHQAASDLRRGTGRTRAVGVLVQDVANDFSSRLLRSLEDAAREHGLAVLAGSLDEDPDRERALVADMVARRVDGLVIMAATSMQDYLQPEQRAGLPIVFVDREPAGIAADSVTVDNRGGARAAVDHLLERGHRRIAFLGDLPSIVTANERHLGYLESLQAAGVPADPSLAVLGLHDEDQAQRALESLFASRTPPTAVFTARNVITVGALRALRARGASWRTALVGFDDLPLFELLDPSVTAVRQDVAALGRATAQILVDRLAGDASPPRRVVLHPELVFRASSNAPV
ncbi:transcriptional regulator, LacI family [Quadrisphaera granulorum]|uniref:LacI family transcriptional regulator n=1 Tax=Quadrisphaera granulorum TaxID=317664 RepID=A0A316AB61_9ACTN|nr:LacI family DNA-binding transcriptional regulator [Quadrisphaera granulorum]PWJ54659.1 LacI family transcriptional regulator [Quadrisphaera granulorum]SZE96021.1 transcriptional regulator, LacI family [Quadrisphaera granulorum]